MILGPQQLNSHLRLGFWLTLRQQGSQSAGGTILDDRGKTVSVPPVPLSLPFSDASLYGVHKRQPVAHGVPLALRSTFLSPVGRLQGLVVYTGVQLPDLAFCAAASVPACIGQMCNCSQFSR